MENEGLEKTFFSIRDDKPILLLNKSTPTSLTRLTILTDPLLTGAL